MKKRLPTILIAIALATIPAWAETVDEIIAKNIEARGGLKALESVRSARVVGSLLVQGMSLPYTLEWKRPDKVRFAYKTHGSQESVQASDGRKGWSLSPRDPEPKELTSDALARLMSRADTIEGDLVNYRDKGNVVKLVGRETVDGRDAYKLEITRAGGDKLYAYLDAKDHLMFREERKSKIDGKVINVISSIGAYRDVEGVKLAHSIDSALTDESGESLGTQAFAIESITLNVNISDRRFEPPR